jgi:hypothetical protein
LLIINRKLNNKLNLFKIGYFYYWHKIKLLGVFNNIKFLKLNKNLLINFLSIRSDYTKLIYFQNIIKNYKICLNYKKKFIQYYKILKTYDLSINNSLSIIMSFLKENKNNMFKTKAYGMFKNYYKVKNNSEFIITINQLLKLLNTENFLFFINKNKISYILFKIKKIERKLIKSIVLLDINKYNYYKNNTFGSIINKKVNFDINKVEKKKTDN